MLSKKGLSYGYGVVIAFFVLLCDQWSKFWAVCTLTNATESVLSVSEKIGRFWSTMHPERTQVVPVFENFWHFRYVENPGAAWGVLSGASESFRTPFFGLVAIFAMIFIGYYLKKSAPHQCLLRFGLFLVLGGAIGNFVDRIRLGYVIDFIDWHWYDKATWPTFNVADSAISVGVVLLMIDMWLQERAAKRLVERT